MVRKFLIELNNNRHNKDKFLLLLNTICEYNKQNAKEFLKQIISSPRNYSTQHFVCNRCISTTNSVETMELDLKRYLGHFSCLSGLDNNSALDITNGRRSKFCKDVKDFAIGNSQNKTGINLLSILTDGLWQTTMNIIAILLNHGSLKTLTIHFIGKDKLHSEEYKQFLELMALCQEIFNVQVSSTFKKSFSKKTHKNIDVSFLAAIFTAEHWQLLSKIKEGLANQGKIFVLAGSYRLSMSKEKTETIMDEALFDNIQKSLSSHDITKANNNLFIAYPEEIEGIIFAILNQKTLNQTKVPMNIYIEKTLPYSPQIKQIKHNHPYLNKIFNTNAIKTLNFLTKLKFIKLQQNTKNIFIAYLDSVKQLKPNQQAIIIDINIAPCSAVLSNTGGKLQISCPVHNDASSACKNLRTDLVLATKLTKITTQVEAEISIPKTNVDIIINIPYSKTSNKPTVTISINQDEHHHKFEKLDDLRKMIFIAWRQALVNHINNKTLDSFDITLFVVYQLKFKKSWAFLTLLLFQKMILEKYGANNSSNLLDILFETQKAYFRNLGFLNIHFLIDLHSHIEPLKDCKSNNKGNKDKEAKNANIFYYNLYSMILINNYALKGKPLLIKALKTHSTYLINGMQLDCEKINLYIQSVFSNFPNIRIFWAFLNTLAFELRSDYGYYPEIEQIENMRDELKCIENEKKGKWPDAPSKHSKKTQTSRKFHHAKTLTKIKIQREQSAQTQTTAIVQFDQSSQTQINQPPQAKIKQSVQTQIEEPLQTTPKPDIHSLFKHKQRYHIPAKNLLTKFKTYREKKWSAPLTAKFICQKLEINYTFTICELQILLNSLISNNAIEQLQDTIDFLKSYLTQPLLKEILTKKFNKNITPPNRTIKHSQEAYELINFGRVIEPMKRVPPIRSCFGA